ncbi:MAG TPA: RraA family protein [Nitrolancea sp.]|nr:RraA family protein [Nitrolancea sp.]
MTDIIRDAQRTIPADLVRGFRDIGVGDIGHIQQWGFMDTAIRPVWRDIRLVGTAITLRMPSMAGPLNRKVIEMAQPGDVIVIDRGGDTEIACWGGFVTLLAQAKGIAGLIVDGAVTDTMEISDLKWPVYSRSISGLLPRRSDADGEINTTINCGGVPVTPGDLIVGDDDGIVVIRPDEAEPLLEAWRQRYSKSPNIRQWVRDGKSIMDYPGVAKFLNPE